MVIFWANLVLLSGWLSVTSCCSMKYGTLWEICSPPPFHINSKPLFFFQSREEADAGTSTWKRPSIRPMPPVTRRFKPLSVCNYEYVHTYLYPPHENIQSGRSCVDDSLFLPVYEQQYLKGVHWSNDRPTWSSTCILWPFVTMGNLDTFKMETDSHN